MARQSKPTILVVDDEPLNIQILSQALQSRYRIKAATSGEDAIAVANAAQQPDLILLDIKMPGMDGYKVCAHLKEQDSTRNIPVIFITGKNAIEDETHGLELGAVDYITKPFRLPIVMARIRNQLALKVKTDMLETLASIDSLTELANRRRFNEALDIEWRRCSRNQVPLTLMMIDVDHFKQINDCYGHAVGDNCLRAVSDVLEQCVRRSSELLARYGGEEFSAIIPELPHKKACNLAERMRSRVAEIDWHTCVSERVDHPVTVSIGLASLTPTRQHRPEQLLAAADQCLYDAKQSGRNRVSAVEMADTLAGDSSLGDAAPDDISR